MKQSDLRGTQPLVKILLVSDEAATRKALLPLLQKAGRKVAAVENVSAAQIQMHTSNYDVIITDLLLSSPPGKELLELQKRIAPGSLIVLITSTMNLHPAAKAVRDGLAVDYLTKPVSETDLQKAIIRAMGVKRMQDQARRQNSEILLHEKQLEKQVQLLSAELAESYYEITCSQNFALDALVGMLELREKSAAQHSTRIHEFSLLLADALNVPDADLDDIARGARLHDIGKIALPDSILLKPGKLTEEEWAIVRIHPQIGYNIVHSSTQFEAAAEMILSHHEKFDGSGYPRGLRGKEICLGARIFAVVDAYDTMRTGRVYRDPLPSNLAVEEIKRCSGTHFDPEVVRAFLNGLPAILPWDTYDLERD